MSKEKDKKAKHPAEPEAPAAEASAEQPPAEPVAPFPEEALAASQAEAAKNWDLYLRACADLENYRKRAQREKEELSRFANENLLREILPVLDNLERALEHARQTPNDSAGLMQGVEMTLGLLHKVLERCGAVPIEALGQPFDPARHEALGQVESAEHPPNTVIQQLHRGYLLNDRLLRPALVMVARAPAAPSGPAEG